MNPHISLWGCAVCGIRELDGAQHTLPISSLSVLIVPPDQLSQYLNYAPEARSTFSIVMLKNTAGLSTAYYLHVDFLIQHTSGSSTNTCCQDDSACLCSGCFSKLACKRPAIPQFSVAAGFDFGHPLRMGLKRLTILERKLIARTVLFATIVKLVGPCGKTSQQSGLRGHVIAMPHQGAKLAAAKILPRLDSATDLMTVMFVGSAQQWHAVSGKSGDNQRKRFIITHKSIFRVRPTVVFSWLHALKAIGNPFYSDIEIMDNTADTVTRLENLANDIIDKTHIASDELTVLTEEFSASDVADVRSPHDIADGDHRVALNAVLLQNIPLPSSDPASTVLQSLYNTLHNSNVDSKTNNSEPSTDSVADPVLTVPCNKEPINEFQHNDQLFITSFPDLFLHGRKLPKTGSVSSAFAQHLLRQADNRFAQEDEVIFTLFNQSQRHAAARQVATRVRSDLKSVQLFSSIVEASDFTDDLQKAIQSPESSHAQTLLRRIMPLLRVSGTSVPFGPIQRSLAVSQLCAMIHYFGLPAWFVTVSPSDIDSVVILRLAQPLRDNQDPLQFKFVIPPIPVRLEILANNPAAAAEVFIQQLSVIFDCLIALPIHHNLKKSHIPLQQRRQGIFGVPVAHFSAVEVQGRGSLHVHFILIGGVNPETMQAAVNNPELLDIVCIKLDSMVKAEIPDSYHNPTPTDSTENQSGKPDFRPALTLSPLPNIDPDSFWDRVYRTATAVQCHKHTSTCHKGKSGKYCCRMAMPQGCWNQRTGPVQLVYSEILSALDPTKTLCKIPRALKSIETNNTASPAAAEPLPPPDKRTIIYELRRRSSDDAPLHSIIHSTSPTDSPYVEETNPDGPNSNVVAYSPALTAALACNTATYPLGNTVQAKSTCFYLIKYITKDATALTNTLSCLLEAKQTTAHYPSVASDSGTAIRNSMHLITRTLNNLSAKMEISAAMACASLLGLPATVSSHDFWYLFIWPAIKAAKYAQQQHFNISISDDENHYSTDEDEVHTDTHNISSHNQQSLTDILLEGQESLLHERLLNTEDPETGQVLRNKEGNVIVVPQHTHYQYRGTHLKDFCLYDYAGCISVLKKSTNNHELASHLDTNQTNLETDPTTPGRHKNKTFPFDARHPLAESHEQRLRSKQHVPVLAGAPPPPYPGTRKNTKIWNAAAQRYAEYMLSAFVPWDLEILAPIMDLTWDNFCVWASHRQEPQNPLSRHFIENCRFAIVNNISRNMTVSAAEKKLITQWRSRNATQWSSKPCDPNSPNNMEPRDFSVDSNRATTDHDMQLFIEQLRREHGTDVATINSRVHSQAQHNSATVAIISKLFDRSSQTSVNLNNMVPSSVDPLLILSTDEIKNVLQHISQNQTQEDHAAVSEPSLIHCSNNSALPSLQIQQQTPITVQTSPRLNAEQNTTLLTVLAWLSDTLHYEADKSHCIAPPQLLTFIHGGPGVGKSHFAR